MHRNAAIRLSLERIQTILNMTKINSMKLLGQSRFPKLIYVFLKAI